MWRDLISTVTMGLVSFRRHRGIGLWPWCIPLAVVCATGIVLAFSSRTAPSRQGLEMEPASLDFGLVPAASDFTWNLRLTNRGDKKVNVEAIEAGCSCVKHFEPSHFAILPGESTNIQVAIDLSDSSDANESGRAPFSVGIGARCEAGEIWNQKWNVRGEVQHVAEVDRTDVDFGEWVVGSVPPPESVRLRSFVPVGNFAVANTLSFVDAETRKSDSGRGVFDLLLTPRREVPVGYFQEDVVLHAVASQSQDVSVRITGTVLSDFYTVPETVQFGARNVGNKVSQEVKMVSRSDRDIEILSVKCKEGSSSQINISVIAKDRFEVTATVPGPGSFQQTLLVEVKESFSGDESEIPVTVFLYGVEFD